MLTENERKLIRKVAKKNQNNVKEQIESSVQDAEGLLKLKVLINQAINTAFKFFPKMRLETVIQALKDTIKTYDIQ